MSVKFMEKSMIEWNKIMNMYQKSVEFSKTEITRQRQLEIEDFDNEMRPKYNQSITKNISKVSKIIFKSGLMMT